jgi:type II secretory pathway component PulC
MRWLALLVVLFALGCGGAQSTRSVSEEPQVSESRPRTADGAHVIQRASLDRVLEDGPGLFLQRVSTEADIREGQFVGFRLTELRDEQLFAGVDLAVGDTLVEINGQTIERPEDAFTVWSSLAVASELSLVVLRGNERRELRFAIVD